MALNSIYGIKFTIRKFKTWHSFHEVDIYTFWIIDYNYLKPNKLRKFILWFVQLFWELDLSEHACEPGFCNVYKFELADTQWFTKNYSNNS